MNSKDVAVVALLGVALAVALLSIAGANQTGNRQAREEMQQEAIEHGFAEYDAKTGEWKWKGDEKK